MEPRSIARLLAVASLLLAGAARADRFPIQIDGLFDDWQAVPPAYEDAAGDGGADGIDLGRLWVADDPRYLYLRFEVGSEMQLNAGNSLVLYLDTDANAQTGLPIGGIGAELEWRFGARQGTFRNGNASTTVRHAQVGAVALPTVTATAFEMALRRDAKPDGAHPLFPGPMIRILLWDTTGGDRLPNDGEVLTYTLDQGSLPPFPTLPLGRERASDLRLTTNNVHDDGPWDAGKAASFRREYAALAPEILNFQEIYNHSPQQTAALVEGWLPSGPGQTWYASGNQDCKTVSRFPILATWPVAGNLASLVDATSVLGTPLLVVNAHLPCCSDDAGRQREVDQILAFLRDAEQPGGQLTLPAGTPIVIAGDMNFVGLSQQPRSLVTGDIVDEQTYGPDFPPDWDGSSLEDLICRQTERPMAYTYRNDASDYWPGRLDYCVTTGSVLAAGNHYVLWTPDMSADTLAAHGLERGDSEVSDHIPVCADFRRASPSESTDADGRDDAVRFAVLPNPSSGSGTLRAFLAEAGSVRVEVLDASGRHAAYPLGEGWGDAPAGIWSRGWDGRGDDGRRLTPGIYLVRMTVREGRMQTVRRFKWSLLR